MMQEEILFLEKCDICMTEHRRIQFTVKHRKQFDDELILTNNRKGREGRIGCIGSRAPFPHIPITRVTSFRNKPRNTPWPRRCHSQDGLREKVGEGEREV